MEPDDIKLESERTNETSDRVYTYAEMNQEVERRLMEQHESFLNESKRWYAENEEIRKELDTLKTLFRRLLNI